MNQNENNHYGKSAKVYKSVIDKHTPLKFKKVKWSSPVRLHSGHQGLSGCIIVTFMIRNKYLK